MKINVGPLATDTASRTGVLVSGACYSVCSLGGSLADERPARVRAIAPCEARSPETHGGGEGEIWGSFRSSIQQGMWVHEHEWVGRDGGSWVVNLRHRFFFYFFRPVAPPSRPTAGPRLSGSNAQTASERGLRRRKTLGPPKPHPRSPPRCSVFHRRRGRGAGPCRGPSPFCVFCPE